jgi:NAD(P)H dehydrogenase (quinone)
MGRIVISGASGDLGRRVTRLLLKYDPQADLTLVTRTPEKVGQPENQGVRVVGGDYQDRDSLQSAYHGGETLFLISGLNLGRRVSEHRNAIAAAKQAGMRRIVYTSVGGVQPNNPALSAKDHYQTELDLRASGLEYTILRNSLYSEIVSNILVGPAAAAGLMTQATGDGCLAPVAKNDVARSAVCCLLDGERHAGAVYEITGNELLNFDDIAAIGSDVHGVPIKYVRVSAEERLAFFDSVGIPRTYDPNMPPSADGHLWASDELVSAELAIAEGYQAVLSHHVKHITGRDPESLQSVMERVKSVRYDQIDGTVVRTT